MLDLCMGNFVLPEEHGTNTTAFLHVGTRCVLHLSPSCHGRSLHTKKNGWVVIFSSYMGAW